MGRAARLPPRARKRTRRRRTRRRRSPRPRRLLSRQPLWAPPLSHPSPRRRIRRRRRWSSTCTSTKTKAVLSSPQPGRRRTRRRTRRRRRARSDDGPVIDCQLPGMCLLRKNYYYKRPTHPASTSPPLCTSRLRRCKLMPPTSPASLPRSSTPSRRGSCLLTPFYFFHPPLLFLFPHLFFPIHFLFQFFLMLRSVCIGAARCELPVLG